MKMSSDDGKTQITVFTDYNNGLQEMIDNTFLNHPTDDIYKLCFNTTSNICLHLTS